MMGFTWQADGPVAVVTMDSGQNRFNPELLGRFLEILAEIERDESVHSVVVTSQDERSWSQGLDVAWLAALYGEQDLPAIKDFLYGINEWLIRLLTFPLPVIAAINGHCVGMGFISACACDFRFMRSDRGFALLPGVQLGLQFLPGMLAVLRKAMPNPLLEEMILTGGKYGAGQLAVSGVVREGGPSTAAVRETSYEFARSFGQDRTVFGETKRRLHAQIIQTMNEQDPALIDGLQGSG
jgi:Delta3-Delta2-enoyl-CoA isomerase